MEELQKETENGQIDGQKDSAPAERTVLMELDVQMDAGALYDYMLYHMYHGMAGILGTIVGLFMIVYYVGYRPSILYLIFGIVVVCYLPVSLYMSSKRQALANPAFKKPLHYAFTDEGIEISQGESKDSFVWHDTLRAVSTPKSIIIYTSKVNATIIPRKACGGRTTELIKIIATHVEPKKVKIRQ